MTRPLSPKMIAALRVLARSEGSWPTAQRSAGSPATLAALEARNLIVSFSPLTMFHAITTAGRAALAEIDAREGEPR